MYGVVSIAYLDTFPNVSERKAFIYNIIQTVRNRLYSEQRSKDMYAPARAVYEQTLFEDSFYGRSPVEPLPLIKSESIKKEKAITNTLPLVKLNVRRKFSL